MSTGARLGIIGGIVVIAIVALIVLSGSDDDKSDTTTTSTSTTTTTTTQTKQTGPPTYRVVVQGGKPVGGIKKIEVNKGDDVKLVVKSDVADEIHIHGYDLMKDVEAGGTAAFSFPASIDGNFEIEFEDRGEQIAELTVEP